MKNLIICILFTLSFSQLSAVTVTNSDGCEAISSSYNLTNLSVHEEDFSVIQCFPNPTSGMLSIQSNYEINAVQVSNIMGEIVYNSQLNPTDNYKLELPEPKGVYLVRISDNNGVNVFKIVRR